jgi:hypothetical protein
MLTDDEIKGIMGRIESAFKPLRCVAKDWDYKEKLKFRVFDDNDQVILEREKITLRSLKDRSTFQDVIEQARAEVQARGFVLS